MSLEATAVSCACKTFLLVFYVHIIINLILIYTSEGKPSETYLLTNCSLKRKRWDVVGCPLKKGAFKGKLCLKIDYEILLQNNQSVLMDQLPTWMFENDVKKFIDNSIEFLCYYNQLNISDLRWTENNRQSTIQLIGIYSFSSFLLLIHLSEKFCYRISSA